MLLDGLTTSPNRVEEINGEGILYKFIFPEYELLFDVQPEHVFFHFNIYGDAEFNLFSLIKDIRDNAILIGKAVLDEYGDFGMYGTIKDKRINDVFFKDLTEYVKEEHEHYIYFVHRDKL